jgi:hypothetical protein
MRSPLALADINEVKGDEEVDYRDDKVHVDIGLAYTIGSVGVDVSQGVPKENEGLMFRT